MRRVLCAWVAGMAAWFGAGFVGWVLGVQPVVAGVISGVAAVAVTWFVDTAGRPGPVPPEGVRIVHRDGTTTECPVLYAGRDETGCHIWECVQPFDPAAGDRISVDRLPGRTGITFPVGGVL
jgi:hypothetical protein